MTDLLSPSTPGDARPRLMIADKSPVVRSGLRDFICARRAFRGAGYARRAARLSSAAVEQHPTDIGIIGWSLPGHERRRSSRDLEAPANSRRASSSTPASRAKTCCARRCGSAPGDSSPKAMRPRCWSTPSPPVARGRMSLPYIDLQALNDRSVRRADSRERELLTALANGWTNLQIASRIGISRNTVKYHLKNLYDKLGVIESRDGRRAVHADDDGSALKNAPTNDAAAQSRARFCTLHPRSETLMFPRVSGATARAMTVRSVPSVRVGRGG